MVIKQGNQKAIFNGDSGWAWMVLLLCLLGLLGCQKSQPYVLGSVPNYLKPYSPGSPVVTGQETAAGSVATSPPAVASNLPASNPLGTANPGVTASTLPSSSSSTISSVLGLGGSAPSASTESNNFAYAAQVSELERRARLLDENNRQLHSQLAQAQQQVQTYRERSELMQQQLGDMSAQLQQARLAASRAAQPGINPSSLAGSNPLGGMPPNSSNPSIAGPPAIGGLGAAQSRSSPQGNQPSELSRRSGARLTANTSRGLESGSRSEVEALQSLGYPVETNGSSLRLRIPADQLFQPGTAQWTASAQSLLDRISSALRSASPSGQLLIDSFTDNISPSNPGVGSADQLTSQQAEAIADYLVSRSGWNPATVNKRANGSDTPLMDNQTPSGRAANRRIGFIITQDR